VRLALVLVSLMVAPSAAAAVAPATPAAARVLDVALGAHGRAKVTRYQHQTVVRERAGLFAWDCSGMAAWVLRRGAPAALESMGRERPVARDFHRAIDSAPTDRARRGWLRLERLADARPGDVFAWVRPPNWPRRNTGHVGFVVEPPREVPELPGALAVRILDATSVPHQDDTRDPEGEGGIGMGTIVFLVDDAGRPTHYAWHGTASRWAVETRIAVGRVVR